jgi:hypothetical protein
MAMEPAGWDPGGPMALVETLTVTLPLARKSSRRRDHFVAEIRQS